MTRAVEDRLSDALHERLTQRFIDRRTALLMRHLRDEEQLALNLDDSGAVSLGSEHVGKLDGFRFAPDPRAEGIHGRTLRAATLKGLEGEIVSRARALIKAQDADITLSEHGRLWWSGAAVANLAASAHPLTPMVELLADDLLKGDLRAEVAKRLENWVRDHIARVLEPLVALKNAAEARTTAWEQGGLPGPARGLAFQLAENLGQIEWPGAAAAAEMRVSAQGLKRFGVRAGRHALYLPRMIRPSSAALAGLLWAVHRRLAHVPSPPGPGLTSFVLDEEDNPTSDGFLRAAFFRKAGPRAVRLDILERIEEILTGASRESRDADETSARIVSLLGSTNEEARESIMALGWKIETNGSGDDAKTVWQRARPTRQRPKHRGRQRSAGNPDSPFAGLKALITTD
jgi:ATP-dependent RNA helicase SUPV3L1/SUV3